MSETLKTNIVVYDQVSPSLKKIIGALRLTIDSFESLEKATDRGVNTSKFNNARNAILQADIAVAKMEKEIKKSTEAQDKFNQSVSKTPQLYNSIIGKIKTMAGIYLGAKGTKEGITRTDNFINQESRIKLVMDTAPGVDINKQSTDGYRSKILEAATRAKASYDSMSDMASKLDLLAGENFNNDNEVIAFSEIMQKALRLSGASTQDKNSARIQMTQAMASGRLQGDELRAISEAAPMIYKAIADYMGKSKGELKELGSEGVITADIIKNAVLSAGVEIDEAFKTIPNSFESIFTNIKNHADFAFEGVYERILKALNSPQIESFSNAVINTLYAVGGGAEIIIDSIGKGFSVLGGALSTVADFVSNIVVIIDGLIPVVATLSMAFGAYWLITNAAAIQTTILGIWQGILATKAMIATAAQWALNMALSANPIAIVISLVVALVSALAIFGGASITVKTIFSKAFGIIVDTAQIAINTVIGIINKGIRAINKVAGFFGDIIGRDVKTIQEIEFRADYSNFKEKGQDFIDNFSIEDIKGKIKDLGKFEMEDSAYDFDKIVKGAMMPEVGKDIKDDTGKIKKSLEKSEDELKALRDLATIRAINRFSFDGINVNVSQRFGDVHQAMDLDGIGDVVINKLENVLDEFIATSAEGAYDV